MRVTSFHKFVNNKELRKITGEALKNLPSPLIDQFQFASTFSFDLSDWWVCQGWTRVCELFVYWKGNAGRRRWRRVESSWKWSSMEREISDLRGDGNTGQQAAAVPPRRLVYRAILRSVLSTHRRYEYTRHKTRFIAKHSRQPSYNGLSMKEAKGAQGE